MVKDYTETHNAVIIPQIGFRQEKQPENYRRQNNSSTHQNKPPQFYSGNPGHDHKNHHVNHAHTKIAADNGNQAQHENRVSADLNDGRDRADILSVVLDFDNLQGQHQNKGNFYNFIWLDVHGELGNNAGDDQPVQIAGIVVFPQGSEQEEDKYEVKCEQKLPSFFHKELEVDEGKEHVGGGS